MELIQRFNVMLLFLIIGALFVMGATSKVFVDTQYNTNQLLNITNITGDSTIIIDPVNQLEIKSNLTVDENITGDIAWHNLHSYPAVCPAGTYVTQLDDSTTCTGLSPYAEAAVNGSNINLTNLDVTGTSADIFIDAKDGIAQLKIDADGTNKDAIIQFVLDTSNKFVMGVDDSAVLDPFRIAPQTDLSSDTYFEINSFGNVKVFENFTVDKITLDTYAIITTTDGNLTIVPGGDSATFIGDVGTPSSITKSNDNLYISNQLEVDGKTYMDDILTIKSLTPDAAAIQFFRSTTLMAYIAPYGDDGLHLTVRKTDNTANNNFIFTSNEFVSKNFDHSIPSPDTTLFIHTGDPDKDNTKWISLSYLNATEEGLIDVGKGILRLNDDVNISGELTVEGVNATFNQDVTIKGSLTGGSAVKIAGGINVTTGKITLSDFETSAAGGALVVKRNNADGVLFGIENTIAGTTRSSGAGYVAIADGGNYTVDLHSSTDPNNPNQVVHHMYEDIFKEIWRADGTRKEGWSWESSLNVSLFNINPGTNTTTAEGIFVIKSLTGSYTGGNATVCVWDNGTLFAVSDGHC